MAYLFSSMQRLNTFAISTNGTDGIPSIFNDHPGEDSTMPSVGKKSKAGTARDDKKLQQLSQSIKDHATKMVSVSKMKCVQHDQDAFSMTKIACTQCRQRFTVLFAVLLQRSIR